MDGSGGSNTIALIGTIASTTGLGISLLIGVIAIWISLSFHKMTTSIQFSFHDATSKLHSQITDALSRIEASSRVSENAVQEIIGPMMKVVVSGLKENTRSKIDTVEDRFIQRTMRTIDEAFDEADEEQQAHMREKMMSELNALFGTLRSQIDNFRPDHMNTMPITLKAKVHTGKKDSKKRVLPGEEEYSWMPFVRRLRDLEDANKFLAIHWLREKRFANEPEAQQALQVAIDRGILDTHHRDNPNNPEYPTLCCKLNRNHHEVQRVLDVIDESPK